MGSWYYWKSVVQHCWGKRDQTGTTDAVRQSIGQTGMHNTTQTQLRERALDEQPRKMPFKK